jgi:hypothetical protein
MLAMIVLTGWANFGHAEVGDLKDVACDPAIAGAPALTIGAAGFARPEVATNTVHADAVIGRLATETGLTALVAIDAARPDAAGLDVIRFDFTNQAKFTDANSIALKPAERLPHQKEGDLCWAFGPRTLNIQLQEGGPSIPVWVRGQCFRIDLAYTMTLTLGRAKEGVCAVGKKAYPVRLVDLTCNLAVTDLPQAKLGKDGKVDTFTYGDAVVVDTGDGSFAKPATLHTGFYGQPLEIDGNWYEFWMSSDGTKVSTWKLEQAIGKLHIDHAAWRAVLVSQFNILLLNGGKAPVSVPAGKYLVADFEEQAAGDDASAPARLGLWSWFGSNGGVMVSHGIHGSVGRQAKHLDVAVAVATDKATDLAIGSPLTARLKVTGAKDSVKFDFELTDAGGLPLDPTILSAGAPADGPGLTVLDAGGKSVYSAKMEYG